MTITEIKNLLQGEVSSEQLEELRADERKGVQKLLVSYEKDSLNVRKHLLSFKIVFLMRKNFGKKSTCCWS